jgi:hypothetical protein
MIKQLKIAGFNLVISLHQTERRICFRKYWARRYILFENGSNAIVQGITIELRANFNRNFS